MATQEDSKIYKEVINELKQDELKINELKSDNHFIKLQGHTDCCLGLVIENHLFLGDVLFFTGIGRYDLPTGSIKDTMETQRKLKLLTGVDFIYSGHGVSPFAFKK